MDSQGNFVVIWSSTGSGGTDTSSESIHGQRFDSDGNPVGGEFQVNTYTTDEQTDPAVAMDSLGNFVVWESYGSDGTDDDYNSIQGQLYDTDGDPVGGEFQVNTFTTSRQESAAVAADGQGNFIVVWQSNLENIQGQIYDVSGAAVGGEFEIQTTGYGDNPAVAANSVGNFVVAWQTEEGVEPIRVEPVSRRSDTMPTATRWGDSFKSTHTRRIGRKSLRWRWTLKGTSSSPGRVMAPSALTWTAIAFRLNISTPVAPP